MANYIIRYHNKVFKENHEIEVDSLEDALIRIQNMKTLFEIVNVELFKKIEF